MCPFHNLTLTGMSAGSLLALFGVFDYCSRVIAFSDISLTPEPLFELHYDSYCRIYFDQDFV